jgi:hypothetical protein
MIRHVAFAAASIGFLCLAGSGNAADLKAAPAVAAPAVVVPVEDCSAFYDDYERRGFTWGSGPGIGLGFGAMEGARSGYPDNEFPNWYGWCRTWGHYSASGTAHW